MHAYLNTGANKLEALIYIERHAVRGYTNALLELVDEGMFDERSLIQDLLMWMSEDDVAGYCKRVLRDEENECLIQVKNT